MKKNTIPFLHILIKRPIILCVVGVSSLLPFFLDELRKNMLLQNGYHSSVVIYSINDVLNRSQQNGPKHPTTTVPPKKEIFLILPFLWGTTRSSSVPSPFIRHFEVGREIGSRWCIVGLFGGRICRHLENAFPKTIPQCTLTTISTQSPAQPQIGE